MGQISAAHFEVHRGRHSWFVAKGMVGLMLINIYEKGHPAPVMIAAPAPVAADGNQDSQIESRHIAVLWSAS